MRMAGRWRITDAELWDCDALNLVAPAFIEFADDGSSGSFGFIAVQGEMDCREVERDGRPGVEFSNADTRLLCRSDSRAAFERSRKNICRGQANGATASAAKHWDDVCRDHDQSDEADSWRYRAIKACRRVARCRPFRRPSKWVVG